MKKIILPLLAIAVLTGCKKDDEAAKTDDPKKIEYSVPKTYDFGETVSYGGQTDRLNMLSALKSAVSGSHVIGASVSADALKNMYDNPEPYGSAFEGETLGSSKKNLSGKTEGNAKIAMYALLEEIADNSGIEGGENGKAGLVQRGKNDDGTPKYILVNKLGQEYAQLVEKGLMGSCFYNQIAEGYLSDAKIGKDVENSKNEMDDDGKDKGYTKKQHHFDEAFGYFGLPADWDKLQDDKVNDQVRFWGKYCNKRNGVLETNSIFDDFIAGRAAIANDVHDDQVKPVENIKSKIEKVAAGTAINYFFAGITKTELGDKLHALTEGLCFLRACQYGGPLVSAADVADVEKALNDGNFFTIEDSQINAAIDLLAKAAGLESVKTQLK